MLAKRAVTTLRVRIVAVAVALALGLLVPVALLASRGVDSLLLAAVDQRLSSQIGPAVRAVSEGREPSPVPGVSLYVLDIAGVLVGGGGAPLPVDVVDRLKSGVAVQTDDPRVRWVGVVVPAPDGMPRLVAIGTSTAWLPEAVRLARTGLVLAAFVAALATGLTAWVAVGSALRPVAKLRRSVRRLNAGERITPPVRNQELHELAAEFNLLLDRQELATNRLRRFTGDVAHELRSPVASIQLQAEVALAHPEKGAAEEALADVLVETERLSALLHGLMALARSDAGHYLPAVPVELVTQARAAAARADCQGPVIQLNPVTSQAWAAATRPEVELVLDNLLRNAARYARAQIVVTVLAAGPVVRLVVDDDGPGIEPEHRSRVFDRFYRVAADRARDSGGAGLGLALVAELVRRRGGRVRVGESPEGGARFIVTWHSLAEHQATDGRLDSGSASGC